MREEELYDIVKDFLLIEKRCERVLVNKVSFREIKRWVMDVVGVKEYNVYCVEVKKDFVFDSVFAAIKQSEFMCSACTNVYVAFPKEEYSNSDKELRKYLHNICSSMGVGILLIDGKNVTELLSPSIDKVKSKIDFRKYYNVLNQLTGRLDKDEKIRLAKALGIMGLIEWLKDNEEKMIEYEKKYGKKAGQFLAFDTIKYTLVIHLFSSRHRKEAMNALDRLEREAFKLGVGPFEFLSMSDNLDDILGGTNKEFINIIKGFARLLKPYKGNIISLYNDKGPDEVYNELINIRGIGEKTASLLMLELARWFKLGIPSEPLLTDDSKKGLEKIGLDVEDFERKYIPVIDVYGYLLKGGSYGTETEKLLEKKYMEYKETAEKLRKILEESYT